MTDNTPNSSVPDFNELKYTRPDLNKFTETVRNVRLRLMTAKTIEALNKLSLPAGVDVKIKATGAR